MIYEIKDYENIDVGVKAYVIVSFFFGTMIQNQEYTNPFIESYVFLNKIICSIHKKLKKKN